MLRICTHKHSHTESVASRSASPLFSCSASRGAVWCRGPKIQSCISSRLKPSIFRGSICGGLSPQLPLPCPEEEHRRINKPPRVLYASLDLQSCSTSGTHPPAVHAQQRMDTMMNWERHNAEGQSRIWGV